MFSLVITVISIALAAALVLGSLYYGGTAWSEGSIKANATAMVNQAQQVAGALTLYSVDFSGASPGADSAAIFAELIAENYLQGEPQAPKIDGSVAMPAWEIDDANNQITLAGIGNKKVCTAINKNAGDSAADEATGVLSAGINITDVPFGCVVNGGDATLLDFIYRY